MAGGTASIHVDASPEAVYDLLADITRMGEWSPETYRAYWLNGADHAQTGARFRGWNRMGPVRWFTDPIIECAERGRELCFTTTLFGRGRLTTWTFRMHPAAGGGTDLEESWEEQGGLLGRLLPGGRKDQLQAGMEQTLQRVKAAAERS
ncbi:MAG TPA: SRPBCC family protein [Acidimicrobiia bacterium]|nr:SRPBCC family protein [Acidimicrobiia bacterium]